MQKRELVVLTPETAQIKRGASAEEMLYCWRCKEHQGVFLVVMSATGSIDADGTTYDTIILERWRCLNCGNHWIEKYAVKSPEYAAKSPEGGVVNTLLEAIQLKIEGLSEGEGNG